MSWRNLKKFARASASSPQRSEEHTSELQSQSNLVCRLLLEKKNRRHDRLALRRQPALSSIAHRSRGQHQLLHLVRLRSEEHTSELQSESDLVCRLMLQRTQQ